MISKIYSALFFCALFFALLHSSQASLLKTNNKLAAQQNITVNVPSISSTPQGYERFFIINGPCNNNSCHPPFAYCANPTQCV